MLLSIRSLLSDWVASTSSTTGIRGHMLLAIWFDNWGAAGSASASVSLTFSFTASATHSHDHGGGHGHHHHHHWHDDFEFECADDDYWRARQRMLERYHHKEVPQPKHIPHTRHSTQHIEPVVREYNFKVEEVLEMPDLATLLRLEEELAQLALQIRQYELDSDDEEAIALLLS